MAGVSLAEQGVVDEIWPRHTSVKESVFPFSRFSGVDIILGPEMRSTGEVMGIDEKFALAFAKSQMAAGNSLPTEGTVFISMTRDRKQLMIEPARRLKALGFKLVCTSGTARVLARRGDRGRDRPQAAGRAPQPARQNGQRRDSIHLQHAQRQRGPHRRGPHPLGRRLLRRSVRHDDSRLPGRREGPRGLREGPRAARAALQDWAKTGQLFASAKPWPSAEYDSMGSCQLAIRIGKRQHLSNRTATSASPL